MEPQPPETLAAFSRFVEARLGLHFPLNRLSDLERGLKGLAADLGFDDAEACARHLMASPRISLPQMELLAAHLTIGETYFFRDPKAFEALETIALPALLRARAGGPKRLRFWSAGCCTGEEAYSLAIAVSRALGRHSGWQATILATDLNPRFLQKAEAGIYGPWSFRALPEKLKAEYFHETADGKWEIDGSLKKMVNFSCLNLVEDAWPSLASNTNAMDVIFCRNVLMYFSRETVAAVIEKFHRALAEGGWLFNTATDAPHDLFGGFVRSDFPGMILYQKEGPQASVQSAAPASLPAFAPAKVRKTSARVKVRPVPPPLPETRKQEAAPREKPLADYHLLAHNLANEGRFPEALAACDKALETGRLEPAGYYLRGMIFLEQGAHEEAALALRRALYLDPDFVLAHYALGNLMRLRARPDDARRSFENARALLNAWDRDAILPESDGITAGRLLHILSSMQEAGI